MKAILRSGFLALAIMALVVPANARPFEDGNVALDSGDYATALRLLRPLAEQGLAEAQYRLGDMYEFGGGVRQDYAEAVKWFRLAAGQGDARAQDSLAIMYDNGQGVPKDFVQAHMWFNLAAAQGHESAKQGHDRTASQMTVNQLADAQRMAREWMAKHERQPLAAVPTEMNLPPLPSITVEDAPIFVVRPLKPN